MARSFRRSQRMSALSEINVTPLIDLAFSLLIIFMITAPLLEQSIDVNLPSESKKNSQPSNLSMEKITINKEGHYFWDKQRISLSDLQHRITALDPETVIEVRGDKDAHYQYIVTVLDYLKQNKIRKISLDTRVSG